MTDVIKDGKDLFVEIRGSAGGIISSAATSKLRFNTYRSRVAPVLERAFIHTNGIKSWELWEPVPFVEEAPVPTPWLAATEATITGEQKSQS